MGEMMVYIPLNLLLELTECREKLRAIKDFTNKNKYSVDREDLAVLGGFELKKVNRDADV